MEFNLDENQQELGHLAEQIFSARSDPTHIGALEKFHGGHDAELWRILADADLIGAALPEAVGGSGLGMSGLLAILEQQGRRVTPVPLWAVITMGAMPLADHGSDAQKARWLPGIFDGSTVVTGAFDAGPGQCTPLTAVPDGDDLIVSGELSTVPAGSVAHAVVFPLVTADDVVVAVVPTDRSGVRVTPVQCTSRESAGTVRFDGVRVSAEDLLRDDKCCVAEIIERVRTRARIALAALSAGVCAEAIAITAAYTSQRFQFGRPLSANQGVVVRAVDAHLDTERIRLTALKAAWHADRGEEFEARAASLVAKWWAAEGGLRAVHTTQHLHGGIGADIDYPIHRYFLWGRQLAFTLGSAGAVQAELADLLPQLIPIGAQ